MNSLLVRSCTAWTRLTCNWCTSYQLSTALAPPLEVTRVQRLSFVLTAIVYFSAVLLARHFQYKLKLVQARCVGSSCVLPQSDSNNCQCIAFTRWKQHRFSDAMDGFLQVSHARFLSNCYSFFGAESSRRSSLNQMEAMTADAPSPHLFENMAHTCVPRMQKSSP
jgi:hypothetical protein